MNIMTNIKWQKLNGNSQKGLSVTWQMSWQKVFSKDPLLPFQSLPGRSCRARLRWRSGHAYWGCWWWSCSRVWWTGTAGCSPGSTHQTASGYHRRSNFQPEQINKHPWTWNLGNEETPSQSKGDIYRVSHKSVLTLFFAIFWEKVHPKFRKFAMWEQEFWKSI